MTDPNADPPLVTHVEPPLVVPDAVVRIHRPRPGFVEACLLTIAFAVVLFGGVIAFMLLGVAWVWATEGANALKAPPDAEIGSTAAIPPRLQPLLVWSFPIGYALALGFTVAVFRLVVGRGWTREVGLHRLPVTHLLLGMVALPGFIVISDLIARLLFRVSGMEDWVAQQAGLGELFRPFHWSIVVLAIGIGPGIVEELWCRGFLGRGLVGRYGWTTGVILTSLFFGCLHLFPPPYVVTTAIMGAGLHFTYAMSRSLWVPIVLHVLNNSLSALQMVGVIPSEGMERALSDLPLAAGALAVGVLLAAGVAMWTARPRLQVVVLPAIPPGTMVPPEGASTTFVSPSSNSAFVASTIAAVCLSGWLVAFLMG